jgi:hypothetical protein
VRQVQGKRRSEVRSDPHVSTKLFLAFAVASILSGLCVGRLLIPTVVAANAPRDFVVVPGGQDWLWFAGDVVIVRYKRTGDCFIAGNGFVTPVSPALCQ